MNKIGGNASDITESINNHNIKFWDQPSLLKNP